MADLRPLGTEAGHRLRTPAWPDPSIGRDFVRATGLVASRPRGGSDHWLGEHAYCDASRLLRLPPADRRALRPIYRRLFGTEHGYRVDVAARALRPLWVRGVRTPKALAAELLNTAARVDGVDTVIGDATDPLCAALSRRTAPQQPSVPRRSSLVAATPMVLVEDLRPGSGDSTFAATSYLIGRHRVDVLTVTHFSEAADVAAVRDLRVAWWRMHFELEVLRCVLRQWRTDPESLDVLALRQYLDDTIGKINRWRRNGVNQALMISLRTTINDYGRATLIELLDTLRTEAAGLARKIDVLLERTTRDRWLEQLGQHRTGKSLEITFMTDKQEFTFNGPASGVFGNDNKVSGNTFQQGGDAAVAAVLAKLEESLPLVGGQPRAELTAAALELRSATTVEARKSVLQRIAGIAKSVGDVLTPLLSITAEALGKFS